MKCLVTGGLGLIGSHIVKRLLQDGHHVRILDIRPLTEWPLGDLPTRNLEVQQGDIADLYDCHVAMKDMEAVFHTAAIARTVETIDDPLRAHEVNATGTLNLLQVAKKRGIKRFVHSSSSILYVPKTPYFVGKQCAESYVTIFADLYDLSTVSLRYANVFGPGQRRDGAYPNVLAAFARSRAEEGFIVVDGDGKQNRSFIHVDDVVEANMLAFESTACGVFDIGTDVYTSINECAEMFDCEIRRGPSRPGDVFTIKINTMPAREALKFEAKIPFNKKAITSYL